VQTNELDRIGLDPALLLGGTDAEILRCFLDLVRKWRGDKQRSAPRLRQADVAVLVSILGTDSAEIERRLIAATACTSASASLGRRLLLASLGGALSIALSTASIGGGAPVARATTSVSYRHPRTADDDPPSTTTTTSPQHPSTADDVSVPDPQEAPVAPRASAPTTDSEARAAIAVSPAVARGTEATVSIPSLGIDLPVIEGGQSVIDEGVVAHYEAAGWKDPVDAGAAGTYWLAAHHATHGGPFAALPSISVGAEIRVTTGADTFVYTVTSTAVVDLLPGDVAIYGVDESAPVILLQTCVDNTRRFLVHGTLTATLH
jgi:LPXTG-site transpeptidase (sortase) family protein